MLLNINILNVNAKLPEIENQGREAVWEIGKHYYKVLEV